MADLARQEIERNAWDARAKSYDKNVMETFEKAYQLTSTAILEVIKPDSKVLEIGCGTGIVTLSIAPHLKEITGVDISPNMVAIAREKAEKIKIENVDFRVEDAYKLAFENSDFDVVLLPNLLHVVADPEAVLQEAHRLLKPEGVLVTVTDCLGGPAPLKVHIRILYPRLLKLLGKIKYFHFYKKSDLQKLLRDKGFKIIQEAELHTAPVNYLLIGKRT
jgi:ubiquinone/menaquinone biosynthesis C-methylase UbiE